MPSNVNSAYLATCKYHPENDPNCPIYEIGEILKNCETDKSEVDLMLKKVRIREINGSLFKIKNALIEKGGIIEVGFTWNCNYDVLINKPCIPKVHFRRFDNPFKYKTASSGFNFR